MQGEIKIRPSQLVGILKLKILLFHFARFTKATLPFSQNLLLFFVFFQKNILRGNCFATSLYYTRSLRVLSELILNLKLEVFFKEFNLSRMLAGGYSEKTFLFSKALISNPRAAFYNSQARVSKLVKIKFTRDFPLSDFSFSKFVVAPFARKTFFQELIFWEKANFNIFLYKGAAKRVGLTAFYFFQKRNFLFKFRFLFNNLLNFPNKLFAPAGVSSLVNPAIFLFFKLNFSFFFRNLLILSKELNPLLGEKETETPFFPIFSKKKNFFLKNVKKQALSPVKNEWMLINKHGFGFSKFKSPLFHAALKVTKTNRMKFQMLQKSSKKKITKKLPNFIPTVMSDYSYYYPFSKKETRVGGIPVVLSSSQAGKATLFFWMIAKFQKKQITRSRVLLDTFKHMFSAYGSHSGSTVEGLRGFFHSEKLSFSGEKTDNFYLDSLFALKKK